MRQVPVEFYSALRIGSTDFNKMALPLEFDDIKILYIIIRTHFERI